MTSSSSIHTNNSRDQVVDVQNMGVFESSWAKDRDVLSLHASGNQEGCMHASGSSQKTIGGHLILYVDERDQEMYNLIFKAYTLVLLKYKDTVQQIKRRLKFLSDKRGRNHVGYFFNRLRPPDRPRDKRTRKFLM